MLEVPFVDFTEQPVRTLDVKRRLHGVCGQPRFKQRLLLDGEMLSEDALLEEPADLQLVSYSWLVGEQ